MLRPLRTVLLLLAFLLPNLPARASDTPRWMDDLGTLAIQDGGRIMPLDAYARRLAVDLTGRQKWSRSGPPDFAAREPMQLLCDLLFGGRDMVNKRLIAVEDKPFKRLVGLDPEVRFFTATEIAACKGINDLLSQFEAARLADAQASGSRNERKAVDLFNAANLIGSLSGGEPIAIVPAGAGRAFRRAGLSGADAGCEEVRAALQELAGAYTAGTPADTAVTRLREAINAAGSLQPKEARAVSLEVFYGRHNPWRKTQILYGLSIVLFGLSCLTLRRPLLILAVIAAIAGVAEHLLGIGLRIMILERAPVSNTFESLLWMGLVGIAIGGIAQALNRGGLYLFGGVCAAFISVLFAGMVPLTDHTNSLPAVLRSNYWLTVHVLTIVASYGVLAVAAVLGHVYLIRDVIFARPQQFAAAMANPKLSPPIIAQAYRTIQVGLFLLTAGTILGGVWAADSWGRFWGWDPKETWALISIVVYFTVLHARYVRWLRDFGLAASSILGFVVIVWTFYGVNYVMATGLHSYGFGSGGELWVGLWALAEIVLLVVAKVRYASLLRSTSPGAAPATA